MKKYIRKADVILLIILVIVGLVCTVIVSRSGSEGDSVVIEQNGDLFATYSLNEDRTVTVEGAKTTNIVKISNGEVIMSESTCKNQVCVRHSAISRSGESIICLPNRVVVRIEGKGGGYDAVTS